MISPTPLNSWNEPLSVLSPQSLKFFAQATLKSVIQCYKLYFKYFWWIPMILLGRQLALQYCFSASAETYNGLQYYAALFIQSDYPRAFLFSINAIALWLIIRPSVELKSCAYFKAIMIRCFAAFGILILISTSLTLAFYSLLGITWLFAVFCTTDTPISVGNFFRNLSRALAMLFGNFLSLIHI